MTVWRRARGLTAYAAGPALGLATGPVLARSLGPEGRGEFATIMQPLSVAGYVAALGVPVAATYFIAAGHDARMTMRRCLALVSIPCGLVYLAMCAYGVFLADKTSTPLNVLLLFWLAIPITGVVQVYRGKWQGLGSWVRLDLERGTFAVLRAAAIVALAIAGVSISGAYVGAALGSFVLAAGFLIGKPINRGSVPAPPYATLAKYSAAASGTAIAMTAALRVDQAVMPGTSSADQLGYYAVAATVAEVPIIITALASREILQAVSAGQTVSVALTQAKFWVVTVVGAALSVALLADPIIPLFFGADFSASVLPARILCIGAIGNLLVSVSAAVLTGSGTPGMASISPMIAIAITAVAFWLLWGDISASVAAAIWTISQVCAGIVGIGTLAVCLKLTSRGGVA